MLHQEWMLLSATNHGNRHTRRAQQKRAHVQTTAKLLHDKSEHKNSCERLTHGQGNTNDVHRKQNQPWQTGGGPSICSRSPSRQVRISLPTKVKPGRHEYRMMSPVESFTPTVASTHTHTHAHTLVSTFEALWSTHNYFYDYYLMNTDIWPAG